MDRCDGLVMPAPLTMVAEHSGAPVEPSESQERSMARSTRTPSKPGNAEKTVDPVGPTHWVHGEHPERTRPRRGEEPPRNADPQFVPDRIDR
jgi:hypothetical protein